MKIVISGGGTGGHLYPGLSLAKFLNEKGHQVIYIASQNDIDKNIIEKNQLDNIKVLHWDLSGLKRKKNLKSFYQNGINAFKLLHLLNKSKRLLKKEEPDYVIGVGGYISFPIVYQATKLKIKTLIHEQNSFPGLVNRKLAPKVDKVAITYEESRKFFLQAKEIINTSNPRTAECQTRYNQDYSQQLGLKTDKKKILFLGGSLGSETINNLFEVYCNNMNPLEYQAILISGLKNNENISSENKENIVLEHTEQLLEFIASSDLIVSRAGATTLLEIIYLEKKSLIIPSPNVVANHQVLNAREFEKQGLLVSIEEENLTNEKFLEKIDQLLENDKIEHKLAEFDKIDTLKVFSEILGE